MRCIMLFLLLLIGPGYSIRPDHPGKPRTRFTQLEREKKVWDFAPRDKGGPRTANQQEPVEEQDEAASQQQEPDGQQEVTLPVADPDPSMRVPNSNCGVRLAADEDCGKFFQQITNMRDFLKNTHDDVVEYKDPAATFAIMGGQYKVVNLFPFFDKGEHCEADCLWTTSPEVLNKVSRELITNVICADMKAVGPCKNAQSLTDADNDFNILPGLPAGYRWLQSIVQDMIGSKEGKDYSKTCYTKILLLNTGITRPTALDNAELEFSNLYQLREDGNCYHLDPSNAKRNFELLSEAPGMLSLAWGEEKAPDVHAGRPGAPEGRHPTEDGKEDQDIQQEKKDAEGPGGKTGGKDGQQQEEAATEPAWGARANFPGVEKLPLYLPRKRCEICVTVMMRKIAQVPHLCQGLEFYFETCNDVLASVLHWYPNVVYWSYTGGCDKLNKLGGVSRQRPCPPHAICSWLVSPNYNVPFCPWDGEFAAPGLEDSLQRDNGMDMASDGLPPAGGNMGAPIAPMMGMAG